MDLIKIPSTFVGVGYNRVRSGLPLEPVIMDVPRPESDEVLIQVVASSLNPLEYKLADLNFLNRTPPVALGFDVSGIVVAVGADVDRFAPGDEVAAMTNPNGNGGWSGESKTDSYAVSKDFLTVQKPADMSFMHAAALPMCFLSAYLSIYEDVKPGDSIYIPGGGGGVGHLALQMAARVLGAGLIISSGSTAESIRLSQQSGARYVYNYKQDDVIAAIGELTGRRGVDVVYDATYNEAGFVESAKAVRQGGKWIVLGVGPGKTTRLTETKSPVDTILSSRDAKHINVNMLRYFVEKELMTSNAKSIFQRALGQMTDWATRGLVVPHVQKIIHSSAQSISSGLQDLKDGGKVLGKVGVIVDERLID